MNGWLAMLAQVGKHQGRNLWSVMRGRRPLTNAFTCMTLELDDLELVRTWLADRSRWSDDDIVRHFAAAFAAANGSKAAYAFASGREALSAAIEALALPEGSEVLMAGYTCIAVPNAIRFAGARPVYADIETETFGLSVDAARRAITQRTKALLIQHSYGLVCRDYEALLDLAARERLFVIEDCAHALGSTWRGVRVGNRGDVGIYSTERSKVLCTMQGGIAATSNPMLAERLAERWQRCTRGQASAVEGLLRSAIVGYYRHKAPLREVLGDLVELAHATKEFQPLGPSTTPGELLGERPEGYGRRMAPAIAALGLNQLPKLERFAVLRRASGQRWNELVSSLGSGIPRVLEGSVPAFLRYPVLVSEAQKRDTAWAEAAYGVLAGRWFETNLHPAPSRLEGCPNADLAVARCINLPTLVA